LTNGKPDLKYSDVSHGFLWQILNLVVMISAPIFGCEHTQLEPPIYQATRCQATELNWAAVYIYGFRLREGQPFSFTNF